MIATCSAGVSDAEIAEHALGRDVADDLELHLMECSACAERLEKTLAVSHGLQMIASASPRPVVTRVFLDERRAAGVKILEMTLDADHITWTIDDSELYVGVVRGNLSGVDRVDVEYCNPDGTPQAIYPDAPFDRDAGEILVCCDRHVATAHERLRFRVFGVRRDTRELLADCLVEALRY